MLLKPGERTASWGPSWGGRSAWKKPLRFGIGFLIAVGFVVLLWPKFEHRKIPTYPGPNNITISTDVHCPVDFDLLDRLDVKKLRHYLRREVVPVQSDADLPHAQHLDIPLLDDGQLSKVDQDLVKQSQDECLNPLPITLKVPQPPKTADASHIDFGIATTLERLNDSIDAFSHWAGYTRTRIFALIEPDGKVAEVRARADSLGINLHVTESNAEYQARYFSLIEHLAENMREQTRWSCIMDDDTFFPSMRALVDALREYDDSTPVYLGGLSESIPQIGMFGLMGFGGAGVFLSRPLVEQLNDPRVMEECQTMDYTGDRRISYCIYQHTGTHLTIDYRLRQLDIVGDVSGFFEAGREPPLSVHHWKSWFDADMAKLSTVSDACGETCLLRKWSFSDGWMLTNGFSVVKYSNPVDPNDPTMEVTWSGDHGAVLESFLHALGPLRPKDSGKISYNMREATVEDGVVRQYYVHRDSEQGDKILELIWRAG
ncbi:hypothetical protein PHISP_02312 [Aspergillus sp. HF37]|nr:hypothetical protein PHISP_02312 [Aspergillus sp. HF37]